MNTVVTYQLSDRVGTITMDDGKVNCLSPRMLSELGAAFDRAEEDKAVVLLRGREGKFSAGFDLSVFERGGDELRGMLKAGALLATRMLSFPTPVVIGCTGHALAMGAFLLLSGDLRIGVDGPFKIGLNEVAIGMTVPHFGIELARQRLPPAHFVRALLTAEIYSPDGAVAAGFLDRVAPAEDHRAAVRDAAVALTQVDPTAHAGTKRRARASALSALTAAMVEDFGSE